MSSIMSKQLGEFLQEQQEPFILEVYLLERGCSTRRFSSEHVSGYSPNNFGTLLKRSVSSGLKGNRKFIPNCSKFVRGFFSRLLAAADDHKINNSGTREKTFSVSSEIEGRSKETADDDKFSSASSATIFNSCSESDVEDAYYSSRKYGIFASADYHQTSENDHIRCISEVGVEEMFRLNDNKESWQLSPVSVLEETKRDDASPFYKKNLAETDDARRRQFQFSASRCGHKSEMSFGRSDASAQYSRNKKAVQQTKQLLFDCVREVAERMKKDSPDQSSPQILGPDKLWNLICDNISLWSKEPVNETNTSHLVYSEMLASAQEWSKFEQHREDISMQIADAILEDIRNEISDMTNFHESL